MLELWGMWSTSSLPWLPSPLWPGVVAPDRVLSIGQIELNCVLMLIIQMAGAVEYTDCILQRGKTLTTSVLDMILNKLMMK